LLSGEVDVAELQSHGPSQVSKSADDERLSPLEMAIATLQNEVAELKQQFAEFRKQFE